MGGFGILQAAEFATGLYGAYEQTQYDEKERQLAIERHDKAMGIHGELRGRVLPSIAKLGKEQMSMLEGSGVQQKIDVRRRSRERVDSALSNLNRRGLGNTTVGASIQKGFGDFEEDQLARVDEQVREERMQTHGYWGLLGNQLDVDLTGQQINILAGRQIPPQQSFALAASEVLGRFRPAPEAPEAPGTDLATPLIGAGGTLGAAALLAPAKVTVLVCIDGDAMLETLDGQVSIADVQVGDEVMSAEGRLQKVVNKDYGLPYASRQDDFVTIDAQGRTLTVTVDHVISGKPAGEWKAGEVMDRLGLISSVVKAEAVHCGDILLEDGSDYIANGFRVSTVRDLVEATRK